MKKITFFSRRESCVKYTNKQILDGSKLKAFVDNNSSVAEKAIDVFDRVEKIVGRGENAG